MVGSAQTLVLSDADTRAAFDWSDAVRAIERAYQAPSDSACFPPRTMARTQGAWLRTLSGILPERSLMGAKLIAASPAAKAASYLIPLFDLDTMALSALLDGASVTGFRTAATSVLAARKLGRHAAPNVAVIGSGFEARMHLEALANTGPLGSSLVYSPRPSSRAAFCAAMAEKHIAVAPAESAETAVADADLIVCAARSRDETPTLRGRWLPLGATIVSIGSTLPEQREVDSETIDRAALIVADMPEEVANDTGDMIEAAAAGIAFTDRLVALGEIVRGTRSGRSNADEIILYKSVGASIQDLAVAAMCVERAAALGLGRSIPAVIQPVDKGK